MFDSKTQIPLLYYEWGKYTFKSLSIIKNGQYTNVNTAFNKTKADT